MKVVSLALPLPLFREFSYYVPSLWEGKVRVGSVVEVEFRRRHLLGLVHALEDREPQDLKPIIGVVPVASWAEEQMMFVERLSQMCFAPLGEIAALFFPPFLPSQRPLLEKRVFLVQDSPEWYGFPSQGVNLFLFRETFGVSLPRWRKLLAEGVFRLEDEFWESREMTFEEKDFCFWRIAFQEERGQWLKDMIRKAREEERKILVLFPDFRDLDACETMLRKSFPEKKILKYDSRLSTKKRMVAYCLTKEGDYEVILGTRLALFLPASDVYYHILFDPEERGHYSGQSPHYHALHVLYEKVQMMGGALHVVGTIPPLWLYYRLCQGEFREGAFSGSRVPRSKKVKVVSLRRSGGKYVLSPAVREAVAQVVSRGGRVLVWVQKTGYAPALGCKECGFYYLCTECDIALRYHLDGRLLVCPLCGKKVPPQDTCPVCGGHFWESWGEGVERVYEELYRYFPKHPLVRIDSETSLHEFSPPELPHSGIVVGTSALLQEDVLRGSTLLTVLSLENWLYLSSWSARDEFYSTLHRALFFLGADVRELPQVLIQGSPESIEKVEQFLQPWWEFYRQSLQKRQMLGYPPFQYLVRIIGESRNKSRCILVLNELRSTMEERGVTVAGPFPGAGWRKKGKWVEEIHVHFLPERLPEVFGYVTHWMTSVEREPIRWYLEVEQ